MGDLVGQHNGAVGCLAELQLEVHQINADLLHEAPQQVVDRKGILLDQVDLLLGGQLESQGVISTVSSACSSTPTRTTMEALISRRCV